MDGLVIGMDLCDSCTHISCDVQDTIWSVPTRLGKEASADVWRVAEESSATSLEGMIVEDKLISLALKDGTATINGIRYEGLFLLKMFMKLVLDIPKQETGITNIDSLVITVPQLDVKLMDSLMYVADFLKIDRNKVHIISHAESFVYYVMNQKREVWSNQVGMFELSKNGLHYYEMRVQRGNRHLQVVADREELEESFHLNVLDSDAGTQLADRILSSCAERLLKKRLFSLIILTGRGFAKTDWAVNFMNQICKRRRVFGEMDVFTRGALIRAKDYCEPTQNIGNFTCICEGRLKATVSLKILGHDREESLVMAAAGDNWYETRMTAEFIVTGTPEVELSILPFDPSKKKIFKIPLDGFPKRPDRTTRIELALGFSNEDKMLVMIKDLGFGELFPATDRIIKQEVLL